MLGGDSRSAWDPELLDDPRVTSLWDGDRIAGHWFANHRTGGLENPGGVVWDAFLGFTRSARWQQQPSGLVAAGTPIIANTGALERDFAPLLTDS